jgi:hypothetical protein
LKKHNWVGYGRSGDVVEITLKDYANTKIDSFRFNAEDKESFLKIKAILKDKYDLDFSPKISPEESVNAKEKPKKELKEQDVDWFKSDFGW